MTRLRFWCWLALAGIIRSIPGPVLVGTRRQRVYDAVCARLEDVILEMQRNG